MNGRKISSRGDGLTFFGSLYMDKLYNAKVREMYFSSLQAGVTHLVSKGPDERYVIREQYGGASTNMVLACRMFDERDCPVELVATNTSERSDDLVRFVGETDITSSIWEMHGTENKIHIIDDCVERTILVERDDDNWMLNHEVRRTHPDTRYNRCAVMVLYEPYACISEVIQRNHFKNYAVSVASTHMIRKFPEQFYHKILSAGKFIIGGRKDEMDELAQYLGYSNYAAISDPSFNYELLVTNGAKGSEFLRIINGEVVYHVSCSGRKIKLTRRTLGCGDAFFGVFLLNYITYQMPAYDSMQLACEYVSLIHMQKTDEELTDLLGKRVADIRRRKLYQSAGAANIY